MRKCIPILLALTLCLSMSPAWALASDELIEDETAEPPQEVVEEAAVEMVAAPEIESVAEESAEPEKPELSAERTPDKDFTELTWDGWTGNGIFGNGTWGVFIDIYNDPYVSFSGKSYGQYAYGSLGCAWFASARACQITGTDCVISSGTSWYNERYAWYGYTHGTTFPESGKALACYNSHVSVIEAVSGDSVLVSEGGHSNYPSNDYCAITVKTRAQVQSGCIGYVYLTSTNHAPVICVDSVVSNSPGTVTVSGWTYDPDDVTRSIDVHVYLFGQGDPICLGGTTASVSRPDVDNAFHVGEFHGFSATFFVPTGGTLDISMAAINIGAGDNKWADDHKTVSVSSDTQEPRISNVKVSNISSTGYTVTCDVSDDVGIKKVLFPTWTEKGNQDDIIWHEGTIKNGTSTCRINTIDHNHECGTFFTHIYVYDYMNNSASYGTSAEVPSPITNVKVTDISNSGYTITCNIDAEWGATKIEFPTWTLEDGQDDLIWHTGTLFPTGYSTFRVLTSDHNINLNSVYRTHIYVWDRDGNASAVGQKEYPALDVSYPLTFKITYDANGGTGSMTSVTVTHGNSYTLPKCTFTPPEGKEFDKWDLGAPGDKITITKATTVTAQWKDKDSSTPKYQKGDYNKDGKVNRQDRVYIARALAGWSGYDDPASMDLSYADLNGDRKVNRQDRVYLARALAGWDGYPL